MAAVREQVERLLRRQAEGGRRLAPILILGETGTIQDVIQTRIDRLGDAARQTLQIASVLGKEVPLVLLRTVADLPRGGSAARPRPAPGGGVPLRDPSFS